MKKISLVLMLLSAVVFVNAQLTKDKEIASFIKDVVTFEDGDISVNSPISSFNALAVKQASKTIILRKENIVASLEEAKAYKACFITVANHTLAKVTDFDKKLMSGSWGTEMPFGVGYVQKGELTKKEDYINNIIGIPSSQTRMMFLFN